MSSAKRTLTVEQFKQVCISDVLTNEDVYYSMRDVVLDSEKDAREFIAVLYKYRPGLVKKFFNRRLTLVD